MTLNPEYVIGIDPGSVDTGIVIINTQTLSPTYATTLSRNTKTGDISPVTYARTVCQQVNTIIKTHIPPNTLFGIGIEGVEDPKGYHRGIKSPINPKHIIRTAVTAGALAIQFPTACIIRPRGHGSKPKDQYPPALQGRRTPDLPDSETVGSRRHEQSAYDIALETLQALTHPHLYDTETLGTPTAHTHTGERNA